MTVAQLPFHFRAAFDSKLDAKVGRYYFVGPQTIGDEPRIPETVVQKMKSLTALKFVWQRLFSKEGKEWASYVLADRLCGLLYSKYKFSEYSRSWLNDKSFFRFYERFHGRENYHSADRKYFLKNLLKLVSDCAGDTAECGVYQGASSYLICQAFQGIGKEHFVFDSFEGLSEPSEMDGTHWTAHQFSIDEQSVHNNLAEFDFVEIFKGWIPDQFQQVADRKFCFVHIDVDLHQPTLDSVKFFYPRMVPGGILLCDDYGFDGSPGARRAVDNFLRDKPEPIIEVPTGQAFIVKR